MNFFEFAGEHPYLFFLMCLTVYMTATGVANAGSHEDH